MFIFYWLLACVFSIFFFVYCVNTDRFNWATLFSITLIVAGVIFMSNGIMLLCNRSDAENKQIISSPDIQLGINSGEMQQNNNQKQNEDNEENKKDDKKDNEKNDESIE